MERAVVALAVHTAQLDERLTRLERRVEAAVDAAIDAPSQSDLIEVRVHSAKVAAELTRVRVELQGEIERRTTPTPERQRLLTLAESIIDLSDRLDTRPGEIAS